jgi:deoxyxylulose-5-phosphate synthase
MRIYTPSSPVMVSKSLGEAINGGSGPAYLRLGKNGESNLSFDSISFAQWESIRISNPHKKIFILSHGAISKFVEDAIHEINLPNLITFGIVEQIKPFPFDKFSEQAKNSEIIITIEEHYGVGGLFDKVLNAVNKFNFKGKIENISVPHRFITEVGSQENLLDDLFLNTINLEQRIRKAIQDV